MARTEKEEDSFSNAMQLAMGAVFPMTMITAVELGVFEIISKGGKDAKLTAEEITAQLQNCKNPQAAAMLERILVLLVSHGVLDCSVAEDSKRHYSLTDVANHFVPNQDGVSLGPLMVLLHDIVYLQNWVHLKDAVLEGVVPFNQVHGMHVFEYPETDPRFSRLFDKGMLNHSSLVLREVVETYKGFDAVKKLVDVGGGFGVTTSIIVSKFPHIKAINFDLPRVIQNALHYPGVEHVAGDMFQAVPKADAILMKWILHDWDDEHCKTLLRNCYDALPVDGKVIVMDAVVPTTPEASYAAQDIAHMDLFMMTHCPGGKERTKQEFIDLALDAGFKDIKFDTYVCNFWIMELLK